MAKKPAPPKVTRKHLARAERERRQQNIILVSALIVAVLVVGLLSYGVAVHFLTPVAVVNGEKISTGDFRGRVRLAQAQMISQAIYQGQTDQLPSLLEDVESIGQSVLNQLVDEVLIRQEAERRGVTVTEEEIDTLIAETRGFYPGGTPTPYPTFTPNPTMTALASITPTATEGPTPTNSPTNTPGPEPSATPTRTPYPTATEYTEEAYNQELAQELDFLDAQYNIKEDDFRNQYRAAVYRSKLLDMFENEVPRTQEHVHARHILVETEEIAREVLERLAAGESFEDLALEYSTDESNKEYGGDLGRFPRGQMVEPFEDAVFNAQIGIIPDPVETSFGWHVVEVLGREFRELDDYSYQVAVQNAYNDWLVDAHLQAEIKINENWIDRVPNPPSIAGPATQ